MEWIAALFLFALFIVVLRMVSRPSKPETQDEHDDRQW